MKKTLVGLCTFGNLNFSQLTINSIVETAKSPIDLFVVVGKPGDEETRRWLDYRGIPHLVHETNVGFPAALNDIVDWAWPDITRVTGRRDLSRGKYSKSCEAFLSQHYDYLILTGNDIVPYPDGVDALIRHAGESDWEMIGSSMFESKSLVDRYPEARQYFEGANLVFNHWTTSEENGVKEYTPLVRPWEMHNDIHAPAEEPNVLKDVMNLNLFKRSVFEKIGYFDVGFWPNGFFSDNDFCVRANRAGIKTCGLSHSAFFHWWSRTIHQGEIGRPNNKYFERNAKYYQEKFGGPVGGETYQYPFNRGPEALKISSRADEDAVIAKWRDME